MGKIKISDVKDSVDPQPTERALKTKLKLAAKRLNEYKEDHGNLELLFMDLKSSVEAFEPNRSIYRAPARKTKVTNPVCVVDHGTDWHLGACQDADEVEGLNEFNPEILHSRIHNHAGDVLNWVELHRHNYVVNNLHFLLTGDLISGGIHPELLVTNAFPEPQQVVEAAYLIAEKVDIYAPHFKKIIVDFVLVDNHARLTPKPQYKQAGFNTFNYPMAVIVKQLLKKYKNVEFNMYPCAQKLVHVNNRRYLLTHGHQIKGWAGFPYYGVERKAGKEAMKRMRSKLTGFDRIILGHFHASLQHPWYWIGGSASGTDALDHANGREAPPTQSCWFVHPVHGEFDRTDWLLKG